jgi:hypothetical protein
MPDSPAPEEILSETHIFSEDEEMEEALTENAIIEKNQITKSDNENLQSKNFKNTQSSINLYRNKNVSQKTKSNQIL